MMNPNKIEQKKIVITFLPLTKSKEEVFGIVKRSKLLINTICKYSKELKRAGIEVYERHVNIIHTERGYYCAFFEEDLEENRTEKRENPKPFKGIDGRLKVALIDKDGETVVEDLASLVARTFLSNPENHPYVNFKDGNPENVKAENLEYSPVKQNIKQ